jgi:hypothetical protein
MVRALDPYTAGRLARYEGGWLAVFYFYEALQTVIGTACAGLSLRFARRLGLGLSPAVFVVAGMYLASSPVFQTISYNQVNFYVLASLLVALLTVEKQPVIAGAAVAIAGHIKLYPLILGGPWTLLRQWRAVAGIIIGALILLMIQTSGGSRPELWVQFFGAAPHFPRFASFKNNSLESIVLSTVNLGARALGYPPPGPNTAVLMIAGVLALAAVVWMGSRYRDRERVARELTEAGRFDAAMIWRYRLLGHTLDFIALSLLISPLVWVHHYVLAIPLMIWAAATRGDRPGLIGLVAMLIFVLPVFDIYPLSFHRFAGMMILVALTAPRPVAEHWAALQGRE